MRTGNVIKTAYGNLEIIVDVRKDVTHTVSFSHEGSSSAIKNISTSKYVSCECCDSNNVPDSECEDCNGKGSYYVETYGMDKATYLAANVKEYIMKKLLTNFDF